MQLNPTKLVGLFAVSAVLIGAAVFITWLLFGRGLNYDVRRMIQTMAAVDTLTVKTEWADASVSAVPFFPPPAETFSVHFGSQGQVDMTDKTQVAYAQKFAVETSQRGASMSGEYRDLAGTRFLFVKETPKYGDVDLSAFAKQWISIPKAFSFSALSGEGWLNDLSEEDLATLMLIVSKVDLVDSVKTGIVEIINGDATLPYEFTINKEGLRVFLTTLWELRHGQQMDTQTFAELTDKISSWGGAEGTMWIGRKSFLLHRLKIVLADQKLVMDFKDFNEPVEIKTPTADVDISGALHTLGFNVAALPTAKAGSLTVADPPPLFPGATASAAENVNDPDNDGMDNAFEFFYGTDPNNADTDGDGVNDGEEVEHSQNPRGTGSIFSFGLPQ